MDKKGSFPSKDSASRDGTSSYPSPPPYRLVYDPVQYLPPSADPASPSPLPPVPAPAPMTMAPATNPQTSSSQPQIPGQRPGPTAPALNTQQPLLPHQPQPAPPAAPVPPPIVPGTVPPIQPNPATANNVARLANYAYPHYTTYPLNPRVTTNFAAAGDFYPTQPQRPPILVPNHPVFVYYGRDLSSPQLPLPVHYDGRRLFYRMEQGNQTDEGFGPGVAVHPGVKGDVGEQERVNLDLIVRWDRQRMG